MTEAEVLERARGVVDAASDPEAAHPLEDMLYYDLLCSIAEGTCTDPMRCARAALRTRCIEFDRWYA